MLDQFIHICLDVIIVFGAICVILLTVLISLLISTTIKFSRLLNDISEKYMLAKAIISSPFKLIYDFLTKNL